MFRILAIAATLFGLTAAAQADVWRFVDAQGHVQYSDRWVPGSVLVKTENGTTDPATTNNGETRPSSNETSDQQKLNASNAAIAEQQEQNAAQQQVHTELQKGKDEDCKR